MRVIGLDLGERRVGVAVSDPDGTIARPLMQFLPRGRADIVAAVRRLVTEHGAGRVVVGLPLLEDGTRGEQARRAEGVARALADGLAVPVETWDERYSSREADAILDASGRRGQDRRARRDMIAAAVILQAYLDAAGAG
jgi:putative Holliday junction resolvase